MATFADRSTANDRQRDLDGMPFEDRLALPVDREVVERRSRALQRRLKKARLRHQDACFEDIDLARPRGLSRSVALENEPLPVVARIVVDRKSAHYRHDIRVLRMARFEQPKIEKPSPRRKDPLQSALAGFGMPSGAKSVPVEGAPASAWLLGDSLYVRSPHPLASPPWTETASRP